MPGTARVQWFVFQASDEDMCLPCPDARRRHMSESFEASKGSRRNFEGIC